MTDPPPLRIEQSATVALPAEAFGAIIELCDAAFKEETGPYFAAIGPGEHLLAWEGTELVAHLMWVPRWLQPADGALLRSAYVEMVATAFRARGRGLATRLLETALPLVTDFELAALSPATEPLYRRLGWEDWRGPLSHRREGVLHRDPEDRIMYLRLPKTPVELDPDRPLSVEWRPGEVW